MCFLTANSLHAHPANHPVPLITALAAMEVVMLYFLYSMIRGVISLRQTSISAGKLAKFLQKNPGSAAGLLEKAVQAGFDSGLSLLKVVSPQLNLKWDLDSKLQGNVDLANEALNGLVRNPDGTGPEKDMTSLRLTLQATADTSAYEAKWALGYLMLNLVAFWGYLVGPLTFFVRPDHVLSKFTLVNIAAARFSGLDDMDNMWWGVLFGDIAWTIEPVLIMFVKPAMDAARSAAANIITKKRT